MDQYRAYDSRFHISVAELAGIPSLTRAVTENRTRVNVLLDAIPMMSVNLEHADDQHAQLVEAVLAGDPDRAEQLAAEHAQGTAALLRGFLEGGARSPSVDEAPTDDAPAPG